MDQIQIITAVTEEEVQRFWRQLGAYLHRDICPGDGQGRANPWSPDDRQTTEDRLGRPAAPPYFLFFERAGAVIGFAMAVIFSNRDGRCFIREFRILPQFLGSGTGAACAQALMAWAKGHGATYFELIADQEDRQQSWGRLGFRPNGLDEWGAPLMLLPPEEASPLAVSPLTQEELWQLYHLQNSYRQEIGEALLTGEDKERLARAVAQGQITFLAARRATRCVGICSVSTLFSTYACKSMAIFEDFYVEPAWRHKGAARLLAGAAQDWCRSRGISSLWVGCAPCDRAMYQALGFDAPLGELLSWSAP